jgi:predicted esterase
VIERTIATTTHGRYLVDPGNPGASKAQRGLIVGFHGYAEPAQAMLERLRAIPGSDRWLLVAIQGLNRFYQRRTNDVIASWMTRQDRELAIADNLAYVAAVVDSVSSEWATAPAIFSGFSQGVSMAFRAAAAAGARAVIAAGGDVPPEIPGETLAAIESVLLCRGTRDEWYSAEKFAADRQRLADAGVRVSAVEFEGGHEWSSEVIAAAADFLQHRGA